MEASNWTSDQRPVSSHFRAIRGLQRVRNRSRQESGIPELEHLLGWALFVLPCMLLASLFLLHGRRSKLGFSLVIWNLCLYASFMIFELTASHGIPASHRAMWDVGGIWATLFLVAVLAARFLKIQT